ncbi:MAG: alginate export family protein [Pseudomonadota bacterium]
MIAPTVLTALQRVITVIRAVLTVTLAVAEAADAATTDQYNHVFDFDAPPRTEIQLLPNLTFGAKVKFKAVHENNFDLDFGDPDDLTFVEPELSLAFSYDPTDRLQLYLNIEPAYLHVDDEENKKDSETRLSLNEAFVSLDDILYGSTLKLGRQRFNDEREWIYDDELDGGRFYHSFSRFALDFSLTRNNDKDLLNHDDNEDVTNLMVYARYAPDRDDEIGLYAFAQNDQSDLDEDVIFFGLHADGKAWKCLEYWLELAHVRGETDSSDVRGLGLDVGSTYVFDVRFRPSITLAYAYGSGDKDPTDGRDENFRQTGFQDNNAKFNGLIRLKYYGEMVDPELSNLHIATVGTGIRPTRKTSLDLVYHNYRQVEASTLMRDWEIDQDPDGHSTDIGYEIDLVAGYRIRPHHKGSFIVGSFHPGNAFSNDADNALFVELKLQYEF